MTAIMPKDEAQKLLDLIGEFGREVHYLLDDCETSGPVGEEVHTITSEGLEKVSSILDRIEALPFEAPGYILGPGAMLQAAIKQTFVSEADAQAAVALVVEQAAEDFAKDSNLNVRICCNGQDCGCQGATAADYVAYQLRQTAPTDGLALVAELRAERDDAFAAGVVHGQKALQAIKGPLQVVDSPELATLRADNARLAAQVETYGDALEELKQWADAYPTKVFPEPDLARAAAILSQGGMSLDVVSASNMRHVLTRVAQITRAALATMTPAEQADFDLTMRIRGAAGDIAKAQIAAREDGE